MNTLKVDSCIVNINSNKSEGNLYYSHYDDQCTSCNESSSNYFYCPIVECVDGYTLAVAIKIPERMISPTAKRNFGGTNFFTSILNLQIICVYIKS